MYILQEYFGGFDWWFC